MYRNLTGVCFMLFYILLTGTVYAGVPYTYYIVFIHSEEEEEEKKDK